MRRIRARYGDLADDFLKLYPSSDLAESVLLTTRDALYGWTAERLVAKQTAPARRAILYLFDHGYPAADAAGCTASTPASSPMSSAPPTDAAGLAQEPGHARGGQAVGRP
jgi:para-nitrobenzyl esterase